MCLDKVDLSPPKRDSGVGYKVYSLNRVGERRPYLFGREPFTVTQWDYADYKIPTSNGRQWYRTGFHMFATRRAALKWAQAAMDAVPEGARLYVAKVSYSEVVCTGKQNGLKVIVAGQFTFLE